MTAKRDLKRRVRERQARTGESYVTARRRVLAARATPPQIAVPVVHLQDVSVEAARLGFRGSIAMFPALRERVEPTVVLAGLRDALIGTPGDPATVRLFGVAFGIRSAGVPPREQPSHPGSQRFPGPRRAELGRAAEPGSMLAFRVVGRDGVVAVMCMLWGSALVLTLSDGRMEIELSSIAMPLAPVLEPRPVEAIRAALNTSGGDMPAPGPRVAFEAGDSVRVTEGPFANFFATVEEVRADEQTLKVTVSMFGRATSVELGVARVEKTASALFLIHTGRRYRVTTHGFVIGRSPRACDLALYDHNISHRHAAVIHRNGTYYLKDLGSANGILYKGMRIDNKRIDEGDQFQIGYQEVRFTYRADG